MEQKSPKPGGSSRGHESLSYQRRMWKNFQEKTKPWLSPKLGSERRGAAGGAEGTKKESGLWMFRRKKKQLDRVFSSSQPNLCCSTPPPFEGEKTESTSEMSSDAPALGTASGATGSKPELTAHGSPKLPVSQLMMYQQKSSSLGSACFEKLVVDPAVELGEEEQLRKNASDSGINIVGPGNAESQLQLPCPAMYQLDIVLKKGKNLAIRDRTGTSDPYVKFKIGGKEVFRSKTIHKNLNPVWDERVSLLVETLREPLYVKVFDYDFGLQDDFMGSAYLHLESLEHQRTLDVTLELKDPQYPEHNLGSLELAVTLSPKEGDIKDAYQSMRLSDVHRKAQLWRGIVSISLIEGRNLQPMDANGFSDPYVKFKMGHQKYKSKTIAKTLNPQWREQFDFHLYEEQGGYVDITVWDRDAGKKDDFMGRCTIDLSLLSKEHTHKLDLPLEEGYGVLVLLVTLTASAAVSISDMSVNILDDPNERHQITQRYSLWRSLHNLKDVGVVQVKVIRAEGLMAADVTGKSDPFCVVELSNDRLQTHTVYKNLNPEWNKVFTFNVKDIHSVLEVTVYDEDRDRSADFLGKVAIPLLNIQNGERKAYVLKSKELTGPTKGVIFLEIDVIFNAVKAGLRTLTPIEQKYIEEEPKVSKQLLLRNFNRVRRCIMFLINTGCYINSCFEWDSPQRSICAFVIFIIVVWNFELYMIPLALLLPLAWNYILIASGKDTRQDVQAVEDLLEDEDEDFDKDDKDPKQGPWEDSYDKNHILEDILASWHFEWIRVMVDSERKGFVNKLYAIQDVCISVQNALDEVASYGERIKNTFNWTVPFLSWLAIVALVVATVVIYFIPLRFIVLAWGVNKFTKKLRDPYTIDNNELLDFLSRVPSDVQVVQYQQLKLDPNPSPNKRKKNNPG
ncbi:PREDICTED: multiple C2 and transmembrane domain-containing protein 1 isoform X2 [Cyprinodon variegatus]|uniref:multiple C2 and transmembrane domain-containing protein 1 isoform X2 n=1 Tax=Cyprinodon variegatus TaxID=28743 RepID=UPI000742B42B|nr:PREDICTED: multiple C2 and transmembrane domain-containing protein 1 isoform X2 [Cyprinodon variegatus]